MYPWQSLVTPEIAGGMSLQAGQDQEVGKRVLCASPSKADQLCWDIATSLVMSISRLTQDTLDNYFFLLFLTKKTGSEGPNIKSYQGKQKYCNIQSWCLLLLQATNYPLLNIQGSMCNYS